MKEPLVVPEKTSSLQELVKHTEEIFRQQFDRQPLWISAAPGRVNLIGEHTDYNDGYVLPMAIEHYTVIAADKKDTDSAKKDICVYSEALRETKSIPVPDIKFPRTMDWTDYIRGIFAGFQARGIAPIPIDMVVSSTVPVGSGLSSSAALEVATATLLEALTGNTLDPMEKILLCQKAEHGYAGVPCGIMDQYCSVMGRKDLLILLDCRSTQSEMIPFSDPDIAVLITNTNVKHELAGGEYAKRRKDCEAAASALGVDSLRETTLEQLESVRGNLQPVLFKRAHHVITENSRTVNTAQAIQAGNWKYAGQLMFESHASLRDDYNVSCFELDLLVDIAQQLCNDLKGVLGSRMTGGGFGGCTVSLIRTGAIREIKEEIGTRYREKTGLEPDFYITRPAQGATLVKNYELVDTYKA